MKGINIDGSSLAKITGGVCFLIGVVSLVIASVRNDKEEGEPLMVAYTNAHEEQEPVEVAVEVENE